MLLKILTAVLAVLLIAESAYMLTHRRPVHRFQFTTAETWGEFVAFDTVTGRICRTIAEGPADVSDDDNTRFLKKLPACWEIR